MGKNSRLKCPLGFLVYKEGFGKSLVTNTDCHRHDIYSFKL